MDNALCAITVTGIDPDNPSGYTLFVQLENRSTDKNYMFVFENFAVNGLSWGTMSVATLEPGESKDKELCWRGTQYDGIVTEFTDIEMHIRVDDSSDYNAEPAAEETVHIYPLGKDKAVKNERQPKPGDKKLIDNETFSFVVTGFELKTYWGYSGYTMKAYEINKSDMTLNFYVKDAKVNGIDLDPRLGGNTLTAHTSGVDDILWEPSVFLENGITEVTSIQMTITVYDADDLYHGYRYTDTVTINPQLQKTCSRFERTGCFRSGAFRYSSCLPRYSAAVFRIESSVSVSFSRISSVTISTLPNTSPLETIGTAARRSAGAPENRTKPSGARTACFSRIRSIYGPDRAAFFRTFFSGPDANRTVSVSVTAA